MAFIEWSPEYSVGVEAIDDQHRQLFALTNELYVAMMERRARDGLTQAVARMSDYAAEHFSFEERHMMARNYPAYERHRSQHESFIRKTAELRERLEQGVLVLSLEVLQYLRDWLVSHIAGSDKRFAAFAYG